MSASPPSLHDVPLERILALADRLDVRGPRYTSYPTVPVWTRELAPARFADGLGRVGRAGAPVALYLHLPFCRARCLYCGCNSVITHRPERIRRYVHALEREIAWLTAALGPTRRHRQLHLGGGTPTHLPAALLGELCDRVLEAFPGAPDGERSVEVDPRITTAEHLEVLARRGFRRLSAGVQDLNPAVQAAVRRSFAAAELRQFVAAARAAGFTGINLDLIYGLPEQTPASWLATLRSLSAIGPDRLACFGYAHLPSRMAHQRLIDESRLPSPRDRLTMLVDANRYFTAHGYEAVGLDHFARPTDELARARRQGTLWRNFMGYTTTRGLELVGLGSSAISELDELYAQNEPHPERYAEHLEAGTSPLVRGHALDEDDRFRKQLINHLMCNLELDLTAPAQASTELAAALDDAARALEPFVEEGLLVAAAPRYRVTPLGQLFLRNLAMPLDRYLPRQGANTFSRTV